MLGLALVRCGVVRPAIRRRRLNRLGRKEFERSSHKANRASLSLAHGTDEPCPIPNLHAGIGRLLIEHQHGKAPSILVRGKIDIV